MNSQHEEFMRRAFILSEKASLIEKTGGVFGAVIVKNGKIIREGYNQAVKQNDPTWHAEMHAIREACKNIGSLKLNGCTLYSSAEPCPMCLAASYWASIDKIFYGACVEDSKEYGDFQDTDLFMEFKKDASDRRIQCKEMLREEALIVWKKFTVMPDRLHY